MAPQYFLHLQATSKARSVVPAVTQAVLQRRSDHILIPTLRDTLYLTMPVP